MGSTSKSPTQILEWRENSMSMMPKLEQIDQDAIMA